MDAHSSGAGGVVWPRVGSEALEWPGAWRSYEAAVVPPISGLEVARFLPVEVAVEVGAAQQAITAFDERMTSAFGQLELGTVDLVLLRSEASSSSQIEQLTVSAKQLALADLGASKSVNAKLVTSNVEAMQTALADDREPSTDIITEIQSRLLADTGLHIGPRQEQVWIGTSGSSPVGADFVPTHHSRVDASLADLWGFLGQPTTLPLAHIAVAHAQFETIHPFVDGNGRVGRAIIHRYLRKANLASHVTVPISAGLLANTRAYVDALTAYRVGDPVPIVYEMARAAKDSAAVGEELVNELQQLRLAWDERVSARRDSAVWAIADALIGHPAVTAEVAASIAGVTAAAARSAIATLVEAGVLRRASVGRRNQVWVAEEVTGCYDRIAVLIGRRKAY